jgi:hypothetical protein
LLGGFEAADFTGDDEGLTDGGGGVVLGGVEAQIEPVIFVGEVDES